MAGLPPLFLPARAAPEPPSSPEQQLKAWCDAHLPSSANLWRQRRDGTKTHNEVMRTLTEQGVQWVDYEPRVSADRARWMLFGTAMAYGEVLQSRTADLPEKTDFNYKHPGFVFRHSTTRHADTADAPEHEVATVIREVVCPNAYSTVTLTIKGPSGAAHGWHVEMYAQRQVGLAKAVPIVLATIDRAADQRQLEQRYLVLRRMQGGTCAVDASAAHTGGFLRDLFDRSGAGGRGRSRLVPVVVQGDEEPSPEEPSPEEPSPEEPSREEPSPQGEEPSPRREEPSPQGEEPSPEEPSREEPSPPDEEPEDQAPEPACDPPEGTVVWTDVEKCRKQVWTDYGVDVSRMFPERMGQPDQCTFGSAGSRVDYVYCVDCKPDQPLAAPSDPITAALERMRARLFPEAVAYASDLGYSGVRDRIADELEFVGVHVGVDVDVPTRVVAFEPRVIKGRVATEDTDTVLTVLKLWWEGYQQRSGADGARLGADGQFVSVDGACPAVRLKRDN